MKIFIAGPRRITRLPGEVKHRFINIKKNNYTILVGDANGVDKAVQQFFSEQGYRQLLVYASAGRARNNIGSWPIEKVEVSGQIKGFDFYAAKDKKMAESADYGFMIWNGKSKGTLNNMVNLLNLQKKVLLYFTMYKKFYCISSFENLGKIVACCDEATKCIFEDLCVKNSITSLFQGDNDGKILKESAK